MKRFLSTILALVVLIVPVGATSCFADEKGLIGYDQYIVLRQVISSMGLAELASKDLGEVELIVDMDACGKCIAKVYIYNSEGRILKIQKLSKGDLVYDKVKEYIEANYFTSFDMTGVCKYSKVRLSFIMGYPGCKDIGILTARTYDEISGSRVTSFYKLFSLRSCPEIIDKLGLWHQLICAYLLFV